MTTRRYHHGDLRAALIEVAACHIAAQGVGTLSLRKIARELGVTHAAPYRHFADKSALLQAVAQVGFRGLKQALETAALSEDSMLEVGVAYVVYAVGNPGHFEVMFGEQTAQDQSDDGEAAFAVLINAMPKSDPCSPKKALMAWSTVHGIATLVLNGRLTPSMLGLADADLEGFARAVLTD